MKNNLNYNVKELNSISGGDRITGAFFRWLGGIVGHIENSIHASGGQMISPFGSVNSTNFNIGLSYGVSVLNSKK